MHDYSHLYPSMLDYENHYDPDWWVEFPLVDREYVWTYPIALREMSGEPLWNAHIHDLGSQNLSIYVHVPYCRADCPFCVFMRIPVKSPDLSSYASCLANEIRMYATHPNAQYLTVSSIYFGGGTASLLSKPQIEQVLDAIHESFRVAEGVETTIECHPDDVNNQYLIDLKSIGVKRVSFGIQSFKNHFLNAIGRKQNCKHSERIVRQAVDIGFHSVSVDLMYRLPGQSLSDIESDLTQASDMGIHSISAYSLERSVTRLEFSGENQPSDEHDLQMFTFIREYLSSRGFLHVAQPDYALPGHEHRYLMDIWRAPQAQNLGIGAGAFSGHFAGHTYCNVHSPDAYRKAIQSSHLPVMLGQMIDRREALARFFVLGVRCLVVQLENLNARFGMTAQDAYGPQLEILQRLGLIAICKNDMRITRIGEYYVDNISKHFYSEASKGKRQPWGCYLQHLKPKAYFTIEVDQ